MKKILCVLFSIVLLFSLSFHTFAAEAPIENDSAEEQISADNQVKVVKLGDNHDLVYYKGVVTEDLTTDEYRRIVTTSDTAVSEYYEDFSTGIATLSLNGTVTATYDIEELRKATNRWQIPEEDLLLLRECLFNQAGSKNISLPAGLREKYMVTYTFNGGPVVRPIIHSEDYSIRASLPVIHPDGTVTSTYPQYMYKEVDARIQPSSYCARYLDMAIKDSMYGYIELDNNYHTLIVGSTMEFIAGVTKIAVGTLTNTLIGVTNIVNGVTQLASTVQYYYVEEYEFLALRQAYVYDYTNYNRDVSVLTYHGSGKISLTWDFVNNYYCNPAFKITGIAYPFTLAYSDLYAEALQIWEYNMYEHGYWRWGDI